MTASYKIDFMPCAGNPTAYRNTSIQQHSIPSPNRTLTRNCRILCFAMHPFNCYPGHVQRFCADGCHLPRVACTTRSRSCSANLMARTAGSGSLCRKTRTLHAGISPSRGWTTAQALQSTIMSLDVTSVVTMAIPFARSFFHDDANEQGIRKGPGYRPFMPNHGSRPLH